uniref:Ig-like domain-containing protein n=1 Tax=Salarias fasciatus TaxID=181472 RepID=A0A672HJZ2_SALFA
METNKTLLNFSLFPLNGCRVKAALSVSFRNPQCPLVHCFSKVEDTAAHSQYQMVGPSTPVLAMLGVDVVLPCHLEPAADETKSTVEWSRSDLSPRFVHLRRDVVDLPKKQHLSYAGRTHLSSSRLKHGDLSLRLSNVKLSDEGKYSCINHSLTWCAAPPNVAVSAEADGSSGGVVLCCESAGWYPEPELLWLDSEGKLLSAGPPRTLRGPDGLYSVSSRVTVETRPSNTFSCRVYLPFGILTCIDAALTLLKRNIKNGNFLAAGAPKKYLQIREIYFLIKKLGLSNDYNF